jgi:hypothetical protein
MYDVINQALTDFGPWQLKDNWLAFKLEDGTVYGGKNPAMFDGLPAAKKFTDEWKYCYYSFRAALGGITAKDCEIYLDVHRQARAVSARQTDPNATLIMPFEAGDKFRSAQRGEL